MVRHPKPGKIPVLTAENHDFLRIANSVNASVLPLAFQNGLFLCQRADVRDWEQMLFAGLKSLSDYSMEILREYQTEKEW